MYDCIYVCMLAFDYVCCVNACLNKTNSMLQFNFVLGTSSKVVEYRQTNKLLENKTNYVLIIVITLRMHSKQRAY